MNRIISVDIAKGIAIIMVIFAHTISQERNGIREIIYSFHMPLFFILSAYTALSPVGKRDILRRTKKYAKKLIAPLLSLWIVYTTYAYLNSFDNYSSTRHFISCKLLQLIYASGMTNSQLSILGVI